MARYLKSSLYIHLLLHTIIHLSPFINHLKITLKVILKQKWNHFILQVCHSTRNRLPPGKSNARIYNSFISQEKERKNNHKSVRKTYYWKLIFVIYSYSTWARRHLGTKSTQGTLQCKHVRHVGTWLRKTRWYMST